MRVSSRIDELGYVAVWPAQQRTPKNSKTKDASDLCAGTAATDTGSALGEARLGAGRVVLVDQPLGGRFIETLDRQPKSSFGSLRIVPRRGFAKLLQHRTEG